MRVLRKCQLSWDVPVYLLIYVLNNFKEKKNTDAMKNEMKLCD